MKPLKSLSLPVALGLLAALGTPALTSLLLAAPLPRAKPPEPPAEVTAGAYTLEWGGTSDSPTGLGADGYWECDYLSTRWFGKWAWDSKTRTLTVREALGGGEHVLEWSAVLGKDLAGKTTGTLAGIHVKLVRGKRLKPDL